MSDSVENGAGDFLKLYPPEENTDKEDFEMTVTEMKQIENALKDKEFRKLLSEYVEEIRDPENQLTYQTELRQLEKERGNVIHFVNPVAGYVLKTSVDGTKKAFLNICSNTLVGKPSFEVAIQKNRRGNVWSIPYMQSPGRDEFDKAGAKCIVYDVIFHPMALSLAKDNVTLQSTLEQTALEAVEKSFNVSLDKINIKKPKLSYKGLKTAVTIKYKIGEMPPAILNAEQLDNEIPPQPDEDAPVSERRDRVAEAVAEDDCINTTEKHNTNRKNSWTEPKYSIKYRSHLDMQDFCLDSQREGSSAKPVPDEVILTIDLPLIRDSTGLDADVVDDGWYFELISAKQAAYRLKLKLPFQVDDMKSKAAFDKDKRKLIITMKTVPKCNPVRSRAEDDQEHDVLLKSGPGNSEEMQGFTSSGRQASVPEDIPTRFPFKQGTNNSSSGESTDIGSPSVKKTVRFSDDVQKQIYRSNSSILGQKKKNQRKAKNKRKARERLNSGESVSSMDDEDGSIRTHAKSVRERFNSGGSLSSMDGEEQDNDKDDEELGEDQVWKEADGTTEFPHIF